MATFPILLFAFVIAYISILLYKRRSQSVLERGNKSVGSVDRSSKDNNALEGVNRLKILFGTQTGTAEKFAKQLQSKLTETYGASVKAECADLETYAYSENLQKEEYVFFLVATYGDGDPTDSSIEFDEWLSGAAESGEQILEGVKFGVFALGNSEYEHFCSFGKKVERLIGQLGAERVCKRIDGDDCKCIEDDYETWQDDLLQQLDEQDSFADRVHTNGSTVLTKETVPAYNTVYEAPDIEEKNLSAVARVRSSGPSMSHSINMAAITEIRELHQNNDERSCIHVELDITMGGIKYDHGDHVAILPENSIEVVEDAARCLGESLDTKFTLTLPTGNPKNLEPPFPGPISIKSALTKFADLTSAPQKSTLPALAAFASNEEEAERLRFLASSAGKEEYMQLVHKNKMSLIELLEEFPSVRPSLGAFFATICPRIQPRYYSISSSPRMFPSRIHVTAAVVNERKPTGRIHKGVCTNWLKEQEIGAYAPIHIRHSHFKLPSNPETPIVMVGPGTGLAPFRGFLQERNYMITNGVACGPALLFFGCRQRKHDFIYEDELLNYKKSGVLTGLHTAFSRDQAEKDYVTHHLLANKEEVYRLLFGESRGFMYVCGEAARMAKDVHRVLHEVVASVKGCSKSEAESCIKALGDQGRYQKDVW